MRVLARVCEIAVARLKAFYHGYQIESQPGFVDAAVGAGFNGTFFELRGVVVAHHQNFDLRNFLADSTRGVKTASVGHADVQENQIRSQFGGFLESLGGASGFTANLPAGFLGENISYSTPNQVMIIRNKDSH
jgi:hypothetical protein